HTHRSSSVAKLELQPMQQQALVVMGPGARAQLRTRPGRQVEFGAASYRLICAFSVSSTTRSNDDALGGAVARWSAMYLSRFATSAASFSLSALRWPICLLTSSMRCSGFIARRLSGSSSSLMAEKLLRPAVTSATRSPSPVTASDVAFERLLR